MRLFYVKMFIYDGSYKSVGKAFYAIAKKKLFLTFKDSPFAMLTFCSRIFFLTLVLTSCIGTHPFGLRRVQFRTEKMYYEKAQLKEITHTRRVYIKNCPRCKEVLKTRKKQFAEDGTLMYAERMKRRMYTAKIYKVKSKSYYENGTLKEKRKIVNGKGYIRKYAINGKVLQEMKFRDWKPLNGSDSTAVFDDGKH